MQSRAAITSWRAVTALAMFSTIASPSLANDWGTGTGGTARRDGHVDTSGPIDRTIAWSGGVSQPIGAPSAPVIGDGRVFIDRITTFGDWANGSLIVAYDLATGIELWRTSLPLEFPVGSPDFESNGVNRVLAYYNGVVYATRADRRTDRLGRLYLLDAATGSILLTGVDRAIRVVPEDSPAILPDGDVILSGRGPLASGQGTTSVMMRIDSQTGQTLWMTDDTSYRSPGDGVKSWAVYVNRAYGWEVIDDGQVSNYHVSAWDVNTGERIYTSAPYTLQQPNFNQFQQSSLMVGLDGRIYANRDGVAMIALDDTGEDLLELWQRPTGNWAFSTNAIGPDNSVYVVLTERPDPNEIAENRIIRINSVTGDEMYRTAVLPGFNGSRMAVDAEGDLYVGNQSPDGSGRLYCFDNTLQLQWSEPVAGIGVGGPALGGREGGTGYVVVVGRSADIRCYGPRFTFGDGPLLYRGQSRTHALGFDHLVARERDSAGDFGPWMSVIEDAGDGFTGTSTHDSVLGNTAITAVGSVMYAGSAAAPGVFENRMNVLFTVEDTVDATLSGLIDSSGDVNGEEIIVDVILRDETVPPGSVVFGIDAFDGPVGIDQQLELVGGRDYRLSVSLGGEFFGPVSAYGSFSIELAIPTCLCEFDGDAGQVDVFDLLAYLDDWFVGEPSAELTGDASVDVFDLLGFLDCWFIGCP